MDGLEHVLKTSIKQDQIPLNPAFCLTNYKAQGQTFDKLIVNLYKPPNHMTLTMHNIYVILSRLQSIEGLVIMRDIQIEDIQNINFQKGSDKYMNRQIFFESPKNKSSTIPQQNPMQSNIFKIHHS
jgi:hypothetical protein